jgi:RNA polymerase sigma-70 factor, ECF subfamily
MMGVVSRDAVIAAANCASAAWPQITVRAESSVTRVGFVEYLVTRWPDEPPPPERCAELFLTWACARGDPTAIAALERAFFPALIALALRRTGSSALCDEAMQILRERLLVAGEDGQPEIASFQGRGSLAGWLRISATRVLLRFMSKERRSIPLEDAFAERLTAVDDPQRRLLVERYAPAVPKALAAAWAATGVRERNLIRYRYVDGHTVDRIAAIHRVHRATAARWVQRAEQALIDETCRLLADQLGISAAELESLMRLIRSQITLRAAKLFEASP